MKQFFVNTWATILRVGTALIAVFRGAGQGMTVLAVMMIADYITGVLRAAVHDELRRCKYVKSFRLGVYGEGESGVTIVEFK